MNNLKRKYLIATHGTMASGLQSSLDILTNNGQQIKVIDAYITEEDYTSEIQSFMNDVSSEEQGFIFTDLYGGSVNQKVAIELMSAKKENIILISNSNLAIILSIMFHQKEEKLGEKDIEDLIDECKIQLVDTNLEDNL